MYHTTNEIDGPPTTLTHMSLGPKDMFNKCINEIKALVQAERQTRIEQQYRPRMKVGKHKGQFLDKVPLNYVKFMYSKRPDDHRTLKAEIERRAAKIKAMRFWYNNSDKLPFLTREDGSATRPITYVHAHYDRPRWYTAVRVERKRLYQPLIYSPHNYHEWLPKTVYRTKHEWWQLTATEPATIKMMDGTTIKADNLPHMKGQWKITQSKALQDRKYHTLFYELDKEEPVAYMPQNSVMIYAEQYKQNLGHIYAGREYFALKFEGFK